MKQVFILGASSVYGVGAEHAGWGDLAKQYFHEYMFSDKGPGETFEVYNFAKSGSTIDFLIDTFPQHFDNYSKSDKVISIVSVGGNNSRANYEPDNYVSTPESYKEELLQLIDLLKAKSESIIFVGNGWVNESKTMPFITPRGNKYYFANDRRKRFEEITKETCKDSNVEYAGIEISVQEWLKKYSYRDGLHPNQAGHQLIFQSLKPQLEKLVDNLH